MALGDVLGVELPGVPSMELPDLRVAFDTGFVIELLEIKAVRRTLDAHVFVLNPRDYSLSEPFEQTLTPTDANTVLEEVQGIIVREIRLEGSFGLREREPRKFAVQTQNARASGNVQFDTLRRLFRTYSELKKNPERAPYIKMAFHSLRDNDHFLVVPKSFDTPRNAKTTRVHYDYRISLLAIGTTASLSEVKNESFGFTDVVKLINQAVSDASSYLTDVNAAIADVRRKVANIDAVLIGVTGLITQAAVAVETSRDLVIRYPFQLARTMADDLERATRRFEDGFDPRGPQTARERQALKGLRGISNSLAQMLMAPSAFQESSTDPQTRVEQRYLGERKLSEEDLAGNIGGASPGSAARIAFGRNADAGLSLGSYAGFREVRVTASMTLTSLAARYSVEPALIAIVNSLKAPYFSSSGEDGTLAPGDIVLIPVTTQSLQTVSATPTLSYQDAGRLLYGNDFALDEEALAEGLLDLAIDYAHGATDVLYASGVTNVKNGLEIIVHTEQGTTQFIPDLGISLPVGGKGTLSSVMLSATTMREALLGDDRIEAIQRATIQLDGDVLRQELWPRIRGKQDGGLPIVSPIGKVTGA